MKIEELRKLQLKREVWDRLSDEERVAMGMPFRP